MNTVPDPDAPLADVAAFARSIDGYEALDVDRGVTLWRSLAALGRVQLERESVERLRLALFFAERSLKWGTWGEEGTDEERAMRSFVRALRAKSVANGDPTRIALVSCVKSKRPTAAPARDLYTSTLSRGLRAYAERVADRWYILSAEHGLVDPDQVLEPYERTLNRMRRAERDRWAGGVREQQLDVLPAGAEVIVLAGQRYREGLVPFLEERGHTVSIPLEGLPFGKQLRFLQEQNGRAA